MNYACELVISKWHIMNTIETKFNVQDRVFGLQYFAISIVRLVEPKRDITLLVGTNSCLGSAVHSK